MPGRVDVPTRPPFEPQTPWESKRERLAGSCHRGCNHAHVRTAFIDHVTLDVRDLAASRRCYAAALAALHAGELSADGAFAYGPPGSAHLWIREGRSSAPLHIAITAPSREHVDAFHRAALAAGGRDNGAPGLRPLYHPAYYAAFVLDPDGNNIEAVHRGLAPE